MPAHSAHIEQPRDRFMLGALGIWIALMAIAGRSVLVDLGRVGVPRRGCVQLLERGDVHVARRPSSQHVRMGVSMFYAKLLLQNFFGNGNFSILGPYRGELWPGRLRGTGMGFVYGVANLGKFIGPAGLALIAGTSNYVKPQATLEALVPGFNYFAFWYVLGAFASWFIGFETSRRSIKEIVSALGRPAGVTAASMAEGSASN